jgi:phage regulator Rha-like protein
MRKCTFSHYLAELYGVSTRVLKQAVRRNRKRFPDDFVFSLSKQEISRLSNFVTTSSRSQSVTLKKGQNIKYPPFAFTENGVAMLSSVLHSESAIEVNVQIMRAFTRLRQILAKNKDLTYLFRELKKKVDQHDVEIGLIIRTIEKMIAKEDKPKGKIGFVG